MTILVTYATRAGSTQEVAEYIADLARKAGKQADVKPVNQIRDVRPYSGVILGSAVRMGNLMPEAVKFVKQMHGQLGRIPVAYFVVCLSATESAPPEEKAKVRAALDKLSEIHPSVSTAMFAGRMDYSKLGWFFRTVLSKGEKKIPEGDFRDWKVIQAWGETILPTLA